MNTTHTRFTSARWPIAGAALLVLCITGGACLFYSQQRRLILEDAEKELSAVADLKVHQIEQWRADRLADAGVVMESPLLVEAVARWLARPDSEPVEYVLTRFRGIAKHKGYTNILLLDTNGALRLALNSTCVEADHEGLALMRDTFAARTALMTDLHEPPGSAVPHLSVVAPLFRQQGGATVTVAAVMLVIDPSRFLYPLIQSWPMPGASAETLLVRREEGAVLFLNELRHRTGTAMRLAIPLSETNVPAVQAVLGHEGMFRGLDYRGVDVLSATRRIPGSPWFMVSKVDADEALAAWQQRAGLILGATFALLAATVACAGWLWQKSRRDHYQRLYVSESQRTRAEQAREELLRTLRDRNEEMENLLYVSSHDLRSPLVNIHGFSQRLGKAATELSSIIDSAVSLEALRDSALPVVRERIPASLGYITTSAAKMDSLISGLLKLSRLGRMPLTPVELDMNKLIASVIVNLTHQATQAHAAVSAGPLPPCAGDEAQISQVFTNLVDNAIKYGRGDRRLEIRITGRIENALAVYCVEDNGPGIARDHQEGVWGLFARLDPQGPVAGEGLGLTVVKRIVQRHCGRVWLESDQGRGSRFFVALPRQKRPEGIA